MCPFSPVRAWPPPSLGRPVRHQLSDARATSGHHLEPRVDVTKELTRQIPGVLLSTPKYAEQPPTPQWGPLSPDISHPEAERSSDRDGLVTGIL